MVNLLQPCRLAADRAADGLLERCGLLVTVDLQHDAQYVTARLPDVEEVAPQRSAWRARQHEALDASLNHHPPALESPRGFFAFLPWAFLHSARSDYPKRVAPAHVLRVLQGKHRRGEITPSRSTRRCAAVHTLTVTRMVLDRRAAASSSARTRSLTQSSQCDSPLLWQAQPRWKHRVVRR